jgi:hypothetical protein
VVFERLENILMHMNDSAAVAGATCVHQRILYNRVHRCGQVRPVVDDRQIGSAQTQPDSSAYSICRALNRLRSWSPALEPDLGQAALT